MPDIVLSFQGFVRKVPLGHPHHVLLGPLRVFHGTEKHTEKEWWALIDALRARPVK